MEMTEDQILSLISSEEIAKIELSLPALTRLFARELAAISPKINRDELTAMLIVGAGLYQKGLKEFREGLDEDAVFDQPQKKRDE